MSDSFAAGTYIIQRNVGTCTMVVPLVARSNHSLTLITRAVLTAGFIPAGRFFENLEGPPTNGIRERNLCAGHKTPVGGGGRGGEVSGTGRGR